jgi:hypothetical protein
MKNKSDSGLSNNLGIIVEAKHEYTKQLCNVIRPVLYESLLTMYNRATNHSENTNDILYHFQKELIKTPSWNGHVIKEEAERIIASCSYFNELITAVFLSNVKILSSVKLGNKNKKFQLVIPTNDNFVHNVYIKVCKKVYDNPYLFSLKRYNNNIMNNMADTFDVIDECIVHAVRDMLPIKNILESYIVNDADELSESDSESGSEQDRLQAQQENLLKENEEENENSVQEEYEMDHEEDPKSFMDNLFEEPVTTAETKEISFPTKSELITSPPVVTIQPPTETPTTAEEDPTKKCENPRSESFFEDV